MCWVNVTDSMAFGILSKYCWRSRDRPKVSICRPLDRSQSPDKKHLSRCRFFLRTRLKSIDPNHKVSFRAKLLNLFFKSQFYPTSQKKSKIISGLRMSSYIHSSQLLQFRSKYPVLLLLFLFWVGKENFTNSRKIRHHKAYSFGYHIFLETKIGWKCFLVKPYQF